MTSRDDNGSRTHEPSLRELTAELDGLRDLFTAKLDALKETINDRDKIYRERDTDRKTAVDAALAAAKEQTKQSFDASEKAIVKAEEAQKAYNTSHNDLAKKLDDQAKATMPRTETEARFASIVEKVEEVRRPLEEVRRSLAQGGGVEQGNRRVKDESRANLAILVSGVGLLIAIALFAWNVTRATNAPLPAPQILYVPAAPGTLIPSAPPTTPTN